MNEVGIRLTLDGQAAVTGGLRQVGTEMGIISRAADSVGNSLRSLAGVAAAGLSVRAFVQAADAVTILNNQLKLATGSTQAASRAFGELFEIAQRSRVSFTELGGTFASIARAGEQLGVSQTRLLGVTEAISNAVAISGGSAESAKAALVQLSQGLASGTLRGDELNSVMEQTPRLAKALADGLGVTTGQLRKLGEAGEITADKVIKALESQSAALKGEVANSIVTVGQAWTQVTNATTKAVGDFDKATGASTTLASALQGVATGIKTLGEYAAQHGTAIKTTVGVLAGLGTAAAVAGLASWVAGLGGIGAALTALGAVVATLNPVTLALLGVGAVVGASVAYANSQSKTIAGITSELRELEHLNAQAANSPHDAILNANVKKRADEIMRLRTELGKLQEAQRLADAPIGSVGSGDTMLRRELARQDALKVTDKAAASAEKAQAKHAATMHKAAADYLADLRAQAKAAETATTQNKALTEEQKALAKVEEMLREGRVREKDIDREAIATAARRIDAAQALRDEADKMAKAQEEQSRALDKWYDLRAKDSADLDNQIAKKREEFAAIGQTVEAIVALTAAKYDEAAANKEAYAAALENASAYAGEFRDAYLQAAQDAKAQAAKLRELAQLETVGGAKKAAEKAREEAKKAAEDAAKEWQKTADKINDAITDSLMRGFENGKGFAENLRDTVVNMFKTMVLRPVVSATVQGGLNTIGLGGPPSGDGVSAPLGLLGKLGTVEIGGSSLAAIGSSFATGIQAGWEGTSLASAVSAYEAAGMTGTASALGAGSSIGAGLAAIPGWGWAAMAALAAFSLSQGGRYVQSTGETDVRFDATGKRTGNEDYRFGYADNAAADKFVDGLNASYLNAAKRLGLGTVATQFAYSGNDAESSTGKGKFSLRSNAGAVQFATGEIARDDAAVSQAASRAVLSALTGSELPKYLTGYLDRITQAQISAMSADQVAAVLNTAQAYRDLHDALAALPLENLQDLSYDAASGLVAAAGGMDKLTQNLGTYYDNFYSAEEKRAQTITNVTKALDAVGLSLPATREAFRALVDAQDVTTESGQKAYATLIGVSGAFASVTDAAKGASASLEREAQERQRWQQKLDVLAGRTTDRQIALQNDLDKAADESTRALIKQVYALEDAATAHQAYLQAVDNAAARLSAAQSAVSNATSAVEAVRAEGTNAYLAALSAVAAAQDRVASIQLNAQIEIARAANDAARAMQDLGRQLHDFVDGATVQPSAQFGRLLTAALGGDKAAMQALPGAANSAIDAARNRATSSVDFAAERARILAQISRVADIADAQGRNTVTVPSGPDELARAQADLTAAQQQLTAALTVANQINAPLTASVNDLVGRYTTAQADLSRAMAELAASQSVLNAIKANTEGTMLGVDQLRQVVNTTLVAKFDTLDASLDGLLSFDEFKTGFVGLASEATLQTVFTELDVNGDSQLTKLEAMRINTGAMLGKFDMLDRTVDGLLSYDEFRSGFSGLASDSTLQAIFRELDANGDGQISKLEAIRSATAPLQDTFNSRMENMTQRMVASITNIESSIAWSNHELGIIARGVLGENGGMKVRFARGASAWDNVYAHGGAFTNSIVNTPTSFDTGLMGEAGPEAIMPLVNINGNLGVRSSADPALLEEMRALRESNESMRAELHAALRAIAIATGKTARLIDRAMPDGDAIATREVTA